MDEVEEGLVYVFRRERTALLCGLDGSWLKESTENGGKGEMEVRREAMMRTKGGEGEEGDLQKGYD